MLPEDKLIAKFFTPLSGDGAFKLRDDAALIKNKAGYDVVTSVDTIAEGIDFFHDSAPEEIAAKALRVNLSDLAAKGAEAFGYLLSISLPKNINEDWLKRFSMQLKRDQSIYDLSLLGGDTGFSECLSITVTIFGYMRCRKMVLRSGAKPGDLVAVTGTIGDAALGLEALKGNLKVNPAYLIKRYRFPQPRSALVSALQKYASAAIDISDGFVGDMQKLCSASQVSASISLENVPHSKAALSAIAKDERWREIALTGGDDYEILLTVPEQNFSLFKARGRKFNVPVTAIGKIVKGNKSPSFFYKKELRTFARSSYRHF
jgi:thiamine-monophosphate kinase